jgi:hypothetical protein
VIRPGRAQTRAAAAQVRVSEASGSREQGAALIIALLITTLLALLGMSHLMLGHHEIIIAENGRDAIMALYVAETGARLAIAWFNDPASGGFLVPGAAQVDRTLRLLDHDADPATPRVRAAAGDPARPLYKDNLLSGGRLFERPYIGTAFDRCLGIETGTDPRFDGAGPDVVVDRSHLKTINALLFPPRPGINLGVRITRMEFYAPPGDPTGTARALTPIATVKIAAGVFLHPGSGHEREVATRVVRAVISAIPPPTPGVALGSCADLRSVDDLGIRWGTGLAAGDAQLPADLDGEVASGLPFASNDPSNYVPEARDLSRWAAAHDGQVIEDPWFRFIAGGSIRGAPNEEPQPWPHDAHGDPRRDHSNLFQHTPIGCVLPDYALWKAIAQSGGRDRYYFSHVRNSLFSLDGTGPARHVRDLVAGRNGVLFFDTGDGLPPDDPLSTRVVSNLTPPVEIAGGRWDARGFIFLNSAHLQIVEVEGLERTLVPPGEPEGTTGFLNLVYPGVADGQHTIRSGASSFRSFRDPVGSRWFCTDASRCDDTARLAALDPVRDVGGLPCRAPVVVDGVLYTSGALTVRGRASFLGSVIARQGVRVEGNTARFYLDRSLLSGEWPRSGLHVPRVVATAWRTDR